MQMSVRCLATVESKQTHPLSLFSPLVICGQNGLFVFVSVAA